MCRVCGWEEEEWGTCMGDMYGLGGREGVAGDGRRSVGGRGGGRGMVEEDRGEKRDRVGEKCTG